MSKEVNLMRVKLLDYLQIDTPNSMKQKRNTRMSGLDNIPLPHGINGKQYFPVDLNGNFQEF
jgi:hypothetical protein